MVAPIPLRCDACGYKVLRTQATRIGDRCPNPYINNGCDGNLAADPRPEAPGYLNQSKAPHNGSPA